MKLLDVNVLIYAHREDAPRHGEFRKWLEEALHAPEPVGLPDLVLSGFLRIVTHPRVFRPPTPMETALRFAEEVRSAPSAVHVAPGERHWELFLELCRSSGVKGNGVPDAYLAALAIESGSEWISTDRGYARFRGLRWRHPLE